MADPAPSPAELKSLLAEVIAGVTDQDEAFWSNLIGDVQRVHLSTNPQSNWKVAPTGDVGDVATINSAVQIVAAQHPYVHW